jgi:hypothetical protein
VRSALDRQPTSVHEPDRETTQGSDETQDPACLLRIGSFNSPRDFRTCVASRRSHSHRLIRRPLSFSGRDQSTIDERWVRSEQLARKRIEQVPDGTYESSYWLDNDGIEFDRRLPFNCKIHIKRDEVTIAVTDIVNQVKGPYDAGMIGGGTSTNQD